MWSSYCVDYPASSRRFPRRRPLQPALPNLLPPDLVLPHLALGRTREDWSRRVSTRQARVPAPRHRQPKVRKMGRSRRRAAPPASLLVQWSGLVQCKIQLENVDARLTQESELTALGVGGDYLPDGIRAGAASRSHAGDLGFGGGGTDVGIEPAPGSGQQVGRYRAGEGRVLVPELLQVTLDPLDQVLVGGAEVRRAGRQAVVAVVAGAGRAAVKIFGPGEALADQLGSHDLIVKRNQAAFRLMVEQHLGKTGDQQRVGYAGQQREDQGDFDCNDELFHISRQT
ncbi:hypothetical protein SBA6_1430002 [Candidatus Sulfopaludibacter sp. SbA6]|nr:hypothetical protein SBA6_1430002 [Candidatus Sulfopaludibacter sp. SbA6]